MNERKIIPARLFTCSVLILLSACCTPACAQQVDSIFFHLYTDSLKKGTYNYINVDGRLHSGGWFPLTEKQLSFSATGGRFERNSLFLDTGFTGEKITVTAILKSDTAVNRSVTIYVKKKDETERLKTKEEVLQEVATPRKKRNR